MIRVRLHVGDYCIAQSDVDPRDLDMNVWAYSSIILQPLHPHSDARVQVELTRLPDGRPAT